MTTTPTTTPTVERSALAVEIEAVTDLDASAAAAWAVLTDFAAYPEWNPFITSLAGELTVGQRLTATLAVPGSSPRTMRPRVVEVVPGRSFTWLGSIGVRGLFDGRHHFEIQPLADGRSRLVQHERLAGVLVPLFRSMLTGPTPAGFAALNEALAARVARRA